MKKIFKSPVFLLPVIALTLTFALLLIARTAFLLSDKKPNILLITAGSLRPDHLSCYGYRSIDTEHIDKLSDKSIRFENAYCSVPVPVYGYASILTGKNGGAAVSERGDNIRLEGSRKLLSEYLKDNGYLTIALLSTSLPLQNMGFSRGFDVFRRPGSTGSAMALLKEYTKKKKPLFIWLDYSIPQYPYDVPENFTGSPEKHPYDRQVLFLDNEISKLAAGLKTLGLDKNTIIIFTSTNGESLNEHKELTHGIFLYNSTVKIPFFIKLPQNSYKGKKIENIVSHVDIPPTLLDMSGITYDPADFSGKTLMTLIKDGNDTEQQRYLYLESLKGHYDYGWSPAVALTSQDHKYIELPRPELYDLGKDPHELNNIVSRDTGKAWRMKIALLDHIKRERPGLLEMIDKGPDPKDKIGALPSVWPRSDDINSLIDFYKGLLSLDPGNKTFKYMLGYFYYKNDNLEESQKYMLELTQAYPDFDKAWESLALVYDRQNDIDNAIKCYEKALSIFPDMPTSLNNLAYHLAEKGIKLNEALGYAEKANELIPDNPAFLDTLANVYLKMNDKEKAEELLKQAIAVEPGSEKAEYLKKKLAEIQKI